MLVLSMSKVEALILRILPKALALFIVVLTVDDREHIVAFVAVKTVVL